MSPRSHRIPLAALLPLFLACGRGEQQPAARGGPGPKESYRVTVHARTASEKLGVSSDFEYEARLAPDPNGDAGELKGAGSYRGFVMERFANCELAKSKAPQRHDVSGKLEASGSVMDMRALGGAEHAMLYVLATTDWPLLPMSAGDSPFAQTAEDKEGVKGLGTISVSEPIALTGRVTTHQEKVELPTSGCGGSTSTTYDIQIERVGGA